MKSSSLIIDTGFLYALYCKNDLNHTKAKEAARHFSHLEWMTTCFVFQEIYWLFKEPIQIFEAEKNGIFKIIDFERSHLNELEKIIRKYSDRQIDLADASLVFLAEQLGHGNILTTDLKDFSVYRWNRTNTFNNLL